VIWSRSERGIRERRRARSYKECGRTNLLMRRKMEPLLETSAIFYYYNKEKKKETQRRDILSMN
jgi:hypothetical protein